MQSLSSQKSKSKSPFQINSLRKDFSQIKVTFESILTLKKVHHVVKLGSWSSLLKSLKSKSLNSETKAAELMLLSQFNPPP